MLVNVGVGERFGEEMGPKKGYAFFWEEKREFL